MLILHYRRLHHKDTSALRQGPKLSAVKDPRDAKELILHYISQFGCVLVKECVL